MLILVNHVHAILQMHAKSLMFHSEQVKEPWSDLGDFDHGVVSGAQWAGLSDFMSC